jgi:hypothetical protein
MMSGGVYTRLAEAQPEAVPTPGSHHGCHVWRLAGYINVEQKGHAAAADDGETNAMTSHASSRWILTSLQKLINTPMPFF